MTAQRETVLITGATSGIGRDFADLFAERGYDLFLASRNGEKMKAITAHLEARRGVKVTTLAVDLARSDAAAKVYETARARHIEISVLVNNAGAGIAGELADMDIGKIQEMIQLNVTTLTELCRLFGGDMKKRRKGCILNVASTAAYQPTPFTAVYGATKSYVLSFSEALAQEMKDYGVSVTCLSPGPTDTNFFAGVGVEGLAEKARGIWAKSRRMPSCKVAEIGLDALFAGKLSVIAGGLNALVAFANRLAPRKTSARLSGKVMKQASTRGSV
jgi:short-subunit dehydrogenase